jgi:glycosyltransferase involved in cell wall biosynthesis
MDLSVVICTRNRAANLAALFASLDAQKLPPQVEWEVVVVDNGSTDGTSDAIKAQAALQPRYRYFREERAGKSFALNRGVAEARGRVLAFTDDDCVVDQNWLREILSEFECDPKLGVLGGRVELFDPRDKPISIVTERQRTEISRTRTFIEPLIIGCNMAVRKSVFAEIGNYDAEMAPGSKSGAITEDIDVIYRIVRRGHHALYSPDVLVRHNHGRRTDEEMKGLLFRYCAGRGAFYAKHMFHDLQVAYCALWDIIKPVKLILRGEDVEREKRFLRAVSSGFFRRLFRWN